MGNINLNDIPLEPFLKYYEQDDIGYKENQQINGLKCYITDNTNDDGEIISSSYSFKYEYFNLGKFATNELLKEFLSSNISYNLELNSNSSDGITVTDITQISEIIKTPNKEDFNFSSSELNNLSTPENVYIKYKINENENNGEISFSLENSSGEVIVVYDHKDDIYKNDKKEFILNITFNENGTTSTRDDILYIDTSSKEVYIQTTFNEMPKIKNGRYTYLDENGIETFSSFYGNKFEKHQGAIREAFWDDLNNTKWLSKYNSNTNLVPLFERTIYGDSVVCSEKCIETITYSYSNPLNDINEENISREIVDELEKSGNNVYTETITTNKKNTIINFEDYKKKAITVFKNNENFYIYSNYLSRNINNEINIFIVKTPYLYFWKKDEKYKLQVNPDLSLNLSIKKNNSVSIVSNEKVFINEPFSVTPKILIKLTDLKVGDTLNFIFTDALSQTISLTGKINNPNNIAFNEVGSADLIKEENTDYMIISFPFLELSLENSLNDFYFSKISLDKENPVYYADFSVKKTIFASTNGYKQTHIGADPYYNETPDFRIIGNRSYQKTSDIKYETINLRYAAPYTDKDQKNQSNYNLVTTPASSYYIIDNFKSVNINENGLYKRVNFNVPKEKIEEYYFNPFASSKEKQFIKKEISYKIETRSLDNELFNFSKLYGDDSSIQSHLEAVPTESSQRGKLLSDGQFVSTRIKNLKNSLIKKINNSEENFNLLEANNPRVTMYNFAKGFIQILENNNYEMFNSETNIEKRNLKNISEMKDPIILKKINSPNEDSSSNSSAAVNIQTDGRDIIQRLKDYECFPINKLYIDFISSLPQSDNSNSSNSEIYYNSYLMKNKNLTTEEYKNNPETLETHIRQLYLTVLNNNLVSEKTESGEINNTSLLSFFDTTNNSSNYYTYLENKIKALADDEIFTSDPSADISEKVYNIQSIAFNDATIEDIRADLAKEGETWRII